MVEIAKALSFDSKILIMDEPTAALNDHEVELLHELIRRFVDTGTGVIYISHKMEELERIADRVTVLRDGAYIDTLDVADASLDQVISLMVGRELSGETRPQVPEPADRPALSVRALFTNSLLRNVSFDVRPGEILGFAGLMGAGRTEVARAVVGADPRVAGTIEVGGEPAKINSPAEAARLGIGYLSEDRKALGLMLNQDVKANILLSSLGRFATPVGTMRDAAMRHTAQSYVDHLRIKTPSVNQVAKHLSGGNQQKVVIARWLAHDCDVLIFDEPTRGIDVGAKEEIYALLEQLAEQGKAIIVISSELPEVLRVSHRIAVMCEGRLNAVLANHEADQETIMEHATDFGMESAA